LRDQVESPAGLSNIVGVADRALKSVMT